MSLFPETFTTGKMIDGVPVPTHLIYNPGAAITKYESYQRSLVQTQHPQPKFSVQEISVETLPKAEFVSQRNTYPATQYYLF